MKEYEQMSMIEVAENLMKKKKTPQPIRKLIKEVAELKGVSEDPDFMTQLYVDITTSAKFVYCGEDNWDLKERQSLDLWDKDGSYFNQGEDLDEDEEDGITVDDYNLEEEVEEDEEDEIVCPECGYFLTADEVEENTKSDGIACPKCGKVFGKKAVSQDEDDDAEEEEYIDEDEYNDMMDDYEDLYDK